MAGNTGMVFNIQKFSLHDGSGIRTLIFMKGCPLRCLWCSNPESQTHGIEIMDVKNNCVRCGKCAALCPAGAIHSDSFNIDRAICLKCGKCAEQCFANAKKTVGRMVSVDELMRIIEKDRIFYRNSNGGVTIGGGEPLTQAAFVEELLWRCGKSHIHTAIETCGYGKWDQIKGVFENTDQIFMDIKCLDPRQHERLTGVDNKLILDNAVKVAALKKETIFRVPIIPSLNDNEKNLRETGAFVESLTCINKAISLELLPYHDFGKNKYEGMGLNYSLPDLSKLKEEQMEKYKRLFRNYKINLI